jgi:two-component system, LytTR family, response regulator
MMEKNKMQDISTIIVDDEESSISVLSLLIRQQCPELKIVGTANNVENALKLIDLKKPKLLFLDIDLPDGTGFDILKKMNHYHYEVIFTTVHNKYAIRAFEVSALHYLLKPISVEKLRDAVNRYSKGNNTNIDEKLKILKDSLIEKPQKILLPTSEGLSVFNISEIVRCEADGNYTTIFFNDKSKLLISKPIKNLNLILTELHFSRVHNKHLVNLKYIKKYVKGKQPYLILECTQESIPISDTRKLEFVKELESYAKQI